MRATLGNTFSLRQVWFGLITIGLCLVVVSIGSELILRAAGYGPWKYVSLDRQEPTMHDADAELGWLNKEGTYTVPPYIPSGEPMHYTFWDHGRRATGPAESGVSQEVIVVGDSFTQGWAISDEETYAWKLQQMFPAKRINNYGTGGYGTYQSLLVLERELPRMKSPAVVLYGFFFHQEVRNVGDPDWLRILATYQKRGHVFVPYVTVDENGGLVRHPPERYPMWPLHERSALVAFLEQLYAQAIGHGREAQKRIVTEKLVSEMKAFSERHGARFIAVLLNGPDDTMKYYKDRFIANQVEVLDCNFALTGEWRVPGEGHPNGRMHTRWAQCISDALQGQAL